VQPVNMTIKYLKSFAVQLIKLMNNPLGIFPGGLFIAKSNI